MLLYTKPRVGECRTTVKFAWIPTTMSNNQVIWLEKYEQKAQFTSEYLEKYHWRVYKRSRLSN